MRIAFFCSEVFASFGGIQRFNQSLIQAMGEVATEQGHGIQVFSINDPAFDKIPQISERVDFRGFGKDKLKFISHALWAAKRADLCLYGHVNMLPLVLGEPFFRSLHRSAVIIHGVEAWRRLPWWGRKAAQRVSAYISVSNFTARNFCQENHLESSRAILLPDTLDPSWSEFLGDSPPIKPNSSPPMLLSVSRLVSSEQYKGIDTVVRALPQVIRGMPTMKYVVVGDGDDRPRLQRLADHLGLQKHVEFTGSVSEERLKGYYQQATVFILPSEQEGFGIVYLEAMAHGLPVIAARSGGAPEIVVDGETGRLVPYGDIEATGLAMEELLKDPDLCGRLGMAGRRRLRKEFCFPIFRKRVAAILRKFEDGYKK